MAQLRDPAYVKIIGQQVAGVSDIQEEACRLIACEVEYALRSVIQVGFGINLCAEMTTIN